MLDEQHESNLDGLERWPGERGLKINHVRILDSKGKLTDVVSSGDAFTVEIAIRAEESGYYKFRQTILFLTPTGIGVTRNFSPYYERSLAEGEIVRLRMHVPACQLTGGEYVFGLGLFENFDLVDGSTAVRYDLLSRAFRLRVNGRLSYDPGLFHQEGEWLAVGTEGNRNVRLAVSN